MWSRIPGVIEWFRMRWDRIDRAPGSVPVLASIARSSRSEPWRRRDRHERFASRWDPGSDQID